MRAVGHYTPEDLQRSLLAALADPACPTPVSFIFDVSQSEVVTSRAPAQIRAIVEFSKTYADRFGRRVAVVATPDAHFGMGRMGAAFAEGFGIEARVFRSEAEARGWLSSPRGA